MKVKLDDVIEVIVFSNHHTESFYHKPSGKIIHLDDPALTGENYDDIIEELEINWDNYIRLPNAFDIDAYRIMEAFIWRLPEGIQQNKLEDAIRGKGAFRRFKQEVRYQGLLDHWYAFESEYHKKLAKSWCDLHHLEYK